MQQNGKMDVRDGDENGKLFVGGLNWDTTHATLLRYFARYGEVIDCVVMKNQATGKSRGFGFVKYKDPSCLETVLASGPHVLDGRQIDPKACNPRSMNKGGKSAEKNKNKVFLGGLPTNATESQIREHFEQFGKVNDVVIMFDQERQKSRGFGFLSFELDESVDRVCQQQFVEVAGKKVECKRAEPRDAKAAGLGGMAGLALAAGGFMPVNGAGLAMHGMTTLGAGSPGLAYPGLQQQGNVMLLPSPLIPLSALTAGGGGGLASPQGLPAWAGMSDVEPAMYPVVSSSSAQAALAASTVMSGAGYGAQMLEPTVATAERQQQMSGYVTTSPLTTSPGAQATSEGVAAEKAGYFLYNSQAAPHLGLLGSYPQEASSYGPARMFAGQEAKSLQAAAQTPYSANITYATAPALLSAGAYGAAMGAGYGGMALPLAAYGGEAPSPTAAYTRAALATQAFHPYRRADDGR